MLKVRPSHQHDSFNLADHLREADVQELQASRGSTPLEALLAGYSLSKPCYTVVKQDRPIAMFGVVPDATPGTGWVWLLASEELVKHRWEFLRKSRFWMERLHKRYPLLTNFVDSRNTVHIKWLKWLGCNFTDKVKHGCLNLPFLEFIHV